MSREKISREAIRRVAKISRLDLSPSEEKVFSKDLESILDAFKIMQKTPTEGIKPSFHPVDLKQRIRKDEIEESLSQEEALSNVKRNKEKGFFKGPKAV